MDTAGLEVPMPVGEATGSLMPPDDEHGIDAVGRHGQHGRGMHLALGQECPALPEPPGGPDDAERRRRVGAGLGEGQRRAHVVMVVLDDVEPPRPIVAGQVRRRPLDQLGEPGRVAPADLVRLAALDELFGGELADRLEHPESDVVVLLDLSDEALVGQLADARQDVEGRAAAGRWSTDGLGGFEVEAAGEDRCPGEEAAAGFVEEPEAPVDGAAQGLLPGRQVSCPTLEQGQAALEAREHGLRTEELDARRGQLDGQGQAVEPGGDGGHGRGILVGHREVRFSRHGAGDEERDGLVERECLERRQVSRIWHAQRRHRVLLLAVDVEQGAAGGQQPHLGPGADQVTEKAGDVGDLLEVVQHEQDATRGQVLDEAFLDGVLTLAHAERRRDGRCHQRRIDDGFDRHEEDAVGIVLDRLGGDLQCQARLARAAGSREGQESRAAEQAPGLGDFSHATHEAGRQDGQVVGRSVERAQRWELVGQAGDDELADALRTREILEPVLPEIPDGHARRQAGLGQGTGGRRNEHLATVTSGSDARGAMDIQADVVRVRRQDAFTGVDAHADPNGHTRRPGLVRQASLGLDRRLDGRARALEDDEEGVALGLDLVTPGGADGIAHQALMPLEDTAVGGGPEPLEQARRSLDVREEEGDGAGRVGGRVRHRSARW